jgi:hypothetical protein
MRLVGGNVGARSAGCQRSSDSAWVTVGVELCGVEVGGVAESEPLQQVFVAWMGGVGQGLGEVGVAQMPPQSSGGAAPRPPVQRG